MNEHSKLRWVPFRGLGVCIKSHFLKGKLVLNLDTSYSYTARKKIVHVNILGERLTYSLRIKLQFLGDKLGLPVFSVLVKSSRVVFFLLERGGCIRDKPLS